VPGAVAGIGGALAASREEGIREMLTADAQAAFGGLRFYPFDQRVRFRVMPTPVRSARAAAAAGVGRLDPAGAPHRPRAVAVPGRRGPADALPARRPRATYPDLLFLPFRDAGAGRETYGPDATSRSSGCPAASSRSTSTAPTTPTAPTA